ncbi:MAG TPA: hypothetical protein VN253_24680 [Kofleriaceae bacterium]|nr:hypothetical protein [Kofleriaceae bacterium]
MADLDVSKPKEPPKPVQIGGESLVDRILPHIKQIIIGVVVIAVIVTVIFGVRWWQQRGQEKETEKLTEVFAVAQRPVAAPGATPDPKNPAFADEKERAKAVLDEMSKQGATPPGHAYRGGLQLEAGNVDEAIAEYRLGVDGTGLDGVLSREGLGIALEAKAAGEKDAAARQKLLEEALASYQRMQPDEKGPRYVYALYHQGRMQAALGKSAEARTLFEKANEQITSGQHMELRELRELLSKRLAALGAA